ncbi:MAG: YheC/YheD family protein [bacterium]|nr:YheC/YheD family protein [bacterium]
MRTPLVGMLTTLTAGRGFGEQSPLFRALLRSARQERCRAYVFTPEGVNWETGTVRGWTAGRGGWRRSNHRLPDVVYDRIVNRRDARRPPVAQAVRRLKARYHGRYFNPTFLDKWDVYQCLWTEPAMRAHLPATFLFAGVETVREVACRWPLIYMKPRSGTQGQQVVRLERLTADPDGAYRVRSPGRVAGRRVSGLQAAVDMAGAGDDFVVQQGIEVPGRRRRPFDVRGLLHRDGAAGWRLTALVARIGRSRGITSNLHTGGTAKAARSFLRLLYRGQPGRAEQALSRLRALALAVPPPIEQRFGPFGELGVDMVLDLQGQPWFLEANARPGRRALVLARAWRERRLAGRRIFRYARSLVEGDDA